MKTFLIRGVPMAVQQDGWWLNAPPPAGRGAPTSKGTPGAIRLGLLAALIALGDVLVWQVLPGLSLAVFGAAIVVAAMFVAAPALSNERRAQVAAGTTLALCPLVELVQPLSLLIAVIGVSAMLALIAGLRAAQLWRGVLRLWPLGVAQTAADACAGLRGAQGSDPGVVIGRLVRGWLMPLTLGLVFAVLLVAANPVAERWLEGLGQADLYLPRPGRIVFWLCLLPVVWTALRLNAMRERLRAAPRPARMGPAPLGLINPASVTRALLLFNAVFALQTGMDVVYLYGGVGLPEGISHAQYAHRGAYPLVVTALLAGGFALLTRRWVQGDAMLRALLMLFVAQNIALVLSALVRLDIYVEAYGLTRLRLSAAIWMALTGAGLALILWQVRFARCNGWLMRRGFAMSAAVLYLCAFVSFDAAIARHNLTHQVDPDTYYLCHLGDAAKPVIAARAPDLCHPANRHIRTPNDWREWGFRNWRARSSLAEIQTGARP